jgi:hypothetical protein
MREVAVRTSRRAVTRVRRCRATATGVVIVVGWLDSRSIKISVTDIEGYVQQNCAKRTRRYRKQFGFYWR